MSKALAFLVGATEYIVGAAHDATAQNLVSVSQGAASAVPGARMIDARGRTVMPGRRCWCTHRLLVG